MTGQDWTTGRKNAGLTQVDAAQALGISQPYLSQLEKGARVGSPALEKQATVFYGLSPTVLPLPDRQNPDAVDPDRACHTSLQRSATRGLHLFLRKNRPTRPRSS